jgi:hypothetical protein
LLVAVELVDPEVLVVVPEDLELLLDFQYPPVHTQ